MPQNVNPRGNPISKIWVVTDEAYEKDSEAGYVYSCPYGKIFERAYKDAGISEAPFYIAITSDICNTGDITSNYFLFLKLLDHFKPSLILSMGKIATALFCPEIRVKQKKNAPTKFEASLEKYAGSLLKSPDIKHDHYIIPQVSPDGVVQNWQYRFIQVGMDLRNVATEFNYLKTNGKLQELPRRYLTIQPTVDELMEFLYECEGTNISVDIETIRPPKSCGAYGKNPGLPYTIAIAISPYRGISFGLWEYSSSETCRIFGQLNRLFMNYPQIGQNYFTFDSHLLESIGFEIDLTICQDTMLRHQILWPELPHKLQFLTKQYTRQPYYKDEGKGWSPKNKKALMHYNALDAVVTYEVYLGQEEEFNDRPYLR